MQCSRYIFFNNIFVEIDESNIALPVCDQKIFQKLIKQQIILFLFFQSLTSCVWRKFTPQFWFILARGITIFPVYTLDKRMKTVLNNNNRAL